MYSQRVFYLIISRILIIETCLIINYKLMNKQYKQKTTHQAQYSSQLFVAFRRSSTL